MSQVKSIDMGQITSTVNVPTTTETAVITSPLVPTTLPTNKTCVDFWTQVTIGTGATSCTPKIYRGASATGTPIFTGAAVSVVAGNVQEIGAHCTDQLAGSDSAQYTLSLTFAAATANSTVQKATAHVEVI